jgi:Flp pilus assembly protein TadD
MYFIIVFGILMLISFLYIARLFVIRLPQMRMSVPETSVQNRDKKKKNELIRQRVERTSNAYIARIKNSIITPVGGTIQDGFRRLAGKLTAVERRFQEKKKRAQHVSNPEILAESLIEAEVLFRNEEYEKAEKKLIEIIGIDNKFTDAYELLGRVYLEKKDLDLAEETFRFLVKMSKADASVNAYLGEVLEVQGKMQEAMAQYRKAVELSPRNPKYLDFVISIALDLEELEIAKEFLATLKEVNPENKKIELFEERLESIS